MRQYSLEAGVNRAPGSVCARTLPLALCALAVLCGTAALCLPLQASPPPVRDAPARFARESHLTAGAGGPRQVALARSGIGVAAEAGGPSARGGDGDRFLDGRWRVVRMVREGKEVKHPAGVKLTMEFRASDHTWSFIVKTPKKSHAESGTWRLNGSQLVTRSEGGTKLERIKVTVLGKDEVELRKAKERLLLKRR